MIDATEGLHNQDLKIADAGVGGRARADRRRQQVGPVEKDDKTAHNSRRRRARRRRSSSFVPFLFTSALTGQRVTRCSTSILEVDAERSKRITTSQVNDALEELLARRQPPQAAGREVKLNYATQVEVAPPTIAVFGNHPDLVQEHYVRYLHNGFRESWGFTRQSAAHPAAAQGGVSCSRCLRSRSSLAYLVGLDPGGVPRGQG